MNSLGMCKDVPNVSSVFQDLRQMKYGDQTRVGFGGYDLSESESAKISLARAVYQDAEVYIVDDIFRYLDSKTAKDIFSA